MELRQAEEKLEELTGYSLKVVERAGSKLVDLLTSSNPWKGKECAREHCLLCKTRDIAGKNRTQDWCQECLDTAENDLRSKCTNEFEKEKGKIKVYKYIGESSRSTYERAYEHMYGLRSLSQGSYMLRMG